MDLLLEELNTLPLKVWGMTAMVTKVPVAIVHTVLLRVFRGLILFRKADRLTKAAQCLNIFRMHVML
jgi:hypothetical protein